MWVLLITPLCCGRSAADDSLPSFLISGSGCAGSLFYILFCFLKIFASVCYSQNEIPNALKGLNRTIRKALLVMLVAIKLTAVSILLLMLVSILGTSKTSVFYMDMDGM